MENGSNTSQKDLDVTSEHSENPETQDDYQDNIPAWRKAMDSDSFRSNPPISNISPEPSTAQIEKSDFPFISEENISYKDRILEKFKKLFPNGLRRTPKASPRSSKHSSNDYQYNEFLESTEAPYSVGGLTEEKKDVSEEAPEHAAQTPSPVEIPKVELKYEGEFKHKADDVLLNARDESMIRYVYQKGIGFIDGNNHQTRFIETSDFASLKPLFGSCVVMVGWSPETKMTGVLHADTTTSIEDAMRLFEERFGKDNVDVSIVGGQTGTSEGIIAQMYGAIANKPNWQIKNTDVLGPKFAMTRQLVVDGSTGDIYDLQGENRINLKPWGVELPESMKMRMYRTNVIDIPLMVDQDIYEENLVK
jgi:hypothetical protein